MREIEREIERERVSTCHRACRQSMETRLLWVSSGPARSKLSKSRQHIHHRHLAGRPQPGQLGEWAATHDTMGERVRERERVSREGESEGERAR